MQNNIYLDHNATTSLRPEVKEVMVSLLGLPQNPSSIHHYGREARKLAEEARTRVLQAVGISGKEADGYYCVFTASGTEANNLALKGLKDATLILSAIEHASILKVEANDKRIRIVPVTKQGVIDLRALAKILADTPGPKVVSVMLANNETGVIQPLKEVVKLVRQSGALIHTDAVQALGKINFTLPELDVDMMTISSHKCGGPVGAAALIFKKKVPITAIISGGGQERGFRAGTENIPAIVGFGLAAELAVSEVKNMQWQRVQKWRDMMEAELVQETPGVVIFGKEMPRLPGTSYIGMPGISSETQLIHFDLAGVAVSSGSACSSGKVSTSHVLLAMGVKEKEAATAVRVSMGIETKEEEVATFIRVWKEILHKLGPRGEGTDKLVA